MATKVELVLHISITTINYYPFKKEYLEVLITQRTSILLTFQVGTFIKMTLYFIYGITEIDFNMLRVLLLVKDNMVFGDQSREWSYEYSELQCAPVLNGVQLTIFTNVRKSKKYQTCKVFQFNMVVFFLDYRKEIF